MSSEPRSVEPPAPTTQTRAEQAPSVVPRPLVTRAPGAPPPSLVARAPLAPRPRATPAVPPTVSSLAPATAAGTAAESMPAAPASPDLEPLPGPTAAAEAPAPPIGLAPTVDSSRPRDTTPVNGGGPIARDGRPAVPPVRHAPMRAPIQRPPAQRLQARAAPNARAPLEGEEAGLERTATAPQLRRFIKSRAYVPMHELRRRFAINGADDEVTPVDLERHRVFVGLPEREGRLLAELLRGGDIGYELSLDPISPIVVGVYPMRPVTRA